MNSVFIEIAGYSAILAVILGLIRLRSIDRAYLPFVLLMILSVAHAYVTGLMEQLGYSNIINKNVYGLGQILLIIWLFHNWKLFKHPLLRGRDLATVFCFFWLMENVYANTIHRLNTFFAILYSLVIVLMSIHMISRLFLTERVQFTRDARFLICIGFVIFYTFKLLTDVFLASGLDTSAAFRSTMDQIMVLIGFIVNLLYAFAAIWIPRKQTSLLL